MQIFVVEELRFNKLISTSALLLHNSQWLLSCACPTVGTFFTISAIVVIVCGGEVRVPGYPGLLAGLG